MPAIFVGPVLAEEDETPKVGNEHFQKALELFPDFYNPATNGVRAIFSNDTARVIQEAVWIETPLDTDFDGQRDLMRVLIRRPIETRTHGLKVPAICNISPYVTTSSGSPSYPFSLMIDQEYPEQGAVPTSFSHTAYRGHDESYEWGTSTTPADLPGQGQSYLSDTIYGLEGDLSYEALSSVTARRIGVGPDATVARHKELLEYDMLKRTADEYTDWHFENFAWLPPARTPTGWQLDGTPTTASPSAGAFGSAATNIPRGIAVLQYRILGSDWAEGFLQYGQYQESLACAAIVDWLNGRVRGFTDATGTVEVEAYWSTGEMGASGTSFEGTCPIAAASTGVQGLRTIAPGAPVTNSYSYYRENGMYYAPGGYVGEDLVNLTWYCIGRFHTAGSPVHPSAKVIDNYWSWQRYLYHYTDDFSGDYTPMWDERNPLSYLEDMRTDVGVIQFHGINDDNVKFKNIYLYNETLKYYGIEVVKGSFHQGAHAMNNGRAGSWTTSANMILWLDHYLWGIENGIVESTPNYEVESNVTANTYNRYDVWPVATEYKKFYPTGGRVGVMKEEPQVRTVAADFEDNVVLRLTRPVNNDAFYVTTANSRPVHQRNAGLLREYRWHTGHGVAIAAAQRHRWRNTLLTGAENDTTAWGAALSGTFATAVVNRYPVSPANVFLNTTNLNIRDRLVYTIPIDETFVVSGTIAVTAEIAPSKTVGILSAMVLEKAANGRMRAVARGSVDIRNPNPDGTLHRDVPGRSNLEKGGAMYPNYMFAPTDIIPGEFYSYTWEMDATEYTFREGREIVLMFYGADPDFTKRPFTGTAFTANIGPRTFLQLPINGYASEADERCECEKAQYLLSPAIIAEIDAEVRAYVTDGPQALAEELIAQYNAILEAHRVGICAEQWKIGDGGDGKVYILPGDGCSCEPYLLGGDAALFVEVGLVPFAYVTKLNGNKNDLTITVPELYTDGTYLMTPNTISINNNAAATYKVATINDTYKVYVDTKGNIQIRECYFVK